MSPSEDAETIEALLRLQDYFPLGLLFNRRSWKRYGLEEILALPQEAPELYRLRVLALGLQRTRAFHGVSAAQLRSLSVANRAMRHLIALYLKERGAELNDRGELQIGGRALELPLLPKAIDAFVRTHPPAPVLTRQIEASLLERPAVRTALRPRALCELFLLANQLENPALWELRELYDDAELQQECAYRPMLEKLSDHLAGEPGESLTGISLLNLLKAPVEHAPADLAGQIDYIRNRWGALLPEELNDQLLLARDLVQEEFRPRGGGPGESKVMRFDGTGGDFGVDYHYEEHEAFTSDRDWMPEVVMMAKMVYVWLDQLSKEYAKPLQHLDDIPDRELDLLVRRGFNCLWLIGLWERSEASRRIKQLKGNPDAAASAYSLYDYVIAADLGGEAALHRLKKRCEARGIRLAADVVPNHTGIDSRWVRQHPHWFIQSPYAPFPTYRFNGPNLSATPELCIQIEDGYFDHTEAAVVFRYEDYRSGEVRYIYHGNDGTHMPWNDTAQLNFLLPEVREAVIGTLLHVARTFKVIRFDAAMTLAKKHYQRLWFPQPGGGAGIASRAEHAMSREEFDRVFPKEFWREVVDRVAQEVPDCLLLAEAFWLMEGYFVRTLGMHRVYNSAFMNMLKKEENAKYREVIKNILEFDADILGRFVNFMNNPDEETAAEQFGSGDKYFGVCVLLATLPGLPMFGHGQLEGRREKYGMEYLRARWDEPADRAKLAHHEAVIFPLLRRRPIFSGSTHFTLYDFWSEGTVDENVFAYSNRLGEDRALVVYNNRHGDSHGWVNLSVEIRDKASGHFGQRSLMEALGFAAGKNRFLAFTEQATGRQHLRPTEELAQRGLELSLAPYQSRVFLDFRLIEDEDGSWENLWKSLGTASAENLERQRRKILYRRQHRALAALVSALEPPRKKKTSTPFPALKEAYREFAEAFAELSDWPSKDLPTLADLRLLPQPAALALPLTLLEHRVGPGTKADRLVELWQDYLLCHPLAEFLNDERELPLCLALIRRLGTEREGLSLGELARTPEIRDFLRCNRYKGILWFNRERLERLLEALIKTLRIPAPALEAPEAATAERLIRRSLYRAEKSGYQLELFLELMGHPGSRKEIEKEE